MFVCFISIFVLQLDVLFKLDLRLCCVQLYYILLQYSFPVAGSTSLGPVDSLIFCLAVEPCQSKTAITTSISELQLNFAKSLAEQDNLGFSPDYSL